MKFENDNVFQTILTLYKKNFFMEIQVIFLCSNFLLINENFRFEPEVYGRVEKSGLFMNSAIVNVDFDLKRFLFTYSEKR